MMKIGKIERDPKRDDKIPWNPNLGSRTLFNLGTLNLLPFYYNDGRPYESANPTESSGLAELEAFDYVFCPYISLDSHFSEKLDGLIKG